jgi:hypothetical protein
MFSEAIHKRAFAGERSAPQPLSVRLASISPGGFAADPLVAR